MPTRPQNNDPKPTCQNCQQEESRIFCLYHRIYLCVPCQEAHHNRTTCFYEPALPLRMLKGLGQVSLHFDAAEEQTKEAVLGKGGKAVAASPLCGEELKL